MPKDDRSIVKKHQEQSPIWDAEPADALAALRALTDAEVLSIHHVSEPLIRAHLTDGQWREVFTLTASRVADAALFLDWLRYAVDALVRDDRTLVEMLRWLSDKTATVSTSYQPVAVRSFYLNRELALTYELAQARADANSMGHTQSLALARGHSLAGALGSELAHIRARARADALARDLKLFPNHLHEQELVLAPDLALDLTLDLALIRSSTRASAHASAREISRAIALSQHLRLADLTQALARLAVPRGNAAPVEMELFTADLQAIMINYRDIGHEWTLTAPQWRQLAEYLAATKLLIECLESAQISDRMARQNLLLLLPHT